MSAIDIRRYMSPAQRHAMVSRMAVKDGGTPSSSDGLSVFNGGRASNLERFYYFESQAVLLATRMLKAGMAEQGEELFRSLANAIAEKRRELA